MPFKKNKNKKLSLYNRNNARAPQNASLTVEAALVFPLVLFVFLFFLSFFRVMQIEQMTEEALALAGAKVSLEAERRAEKDGDTRLYASALAYFYEELNHQSCPVKYVVGGNLGFSFAETKTQGEYLDLRLDYRIALPGGILERMTIPVQQRVYLKKWTGFHGSAEEFEDGDSWVYRTETGTVYHLSRDCTHLKLSIETLPCEQALSGYTPCQICGSRETKYAYYYVTQEGSRYHTGLDCSGLKRTIYMIKRSEVGNRGKCTRCGG